MMRSRFTLLLCLCLLGCEGLIVQPQDAGKPSKPDAPVVQKLQATPQQFFSVFAAYVEEGNISHSQAVVTECSKAMHRAGVTVPANYNDVMGQYAAKNVLLDDTLRKKITADLKGWAK